MSGNEQPKSGCRIGKVKPKAMVFEVESTRPTKSAVRAMLVDALRAIDEGAMPESGSKMPVVGFFGMVHTDGTADMDFVCEEDKDKDNKPFVPNINWRNLAMLFEDAAQDVRNFGVYGQITPYKAATEEED